jgi:hypothetical protein
MIVQFDTSYAASLQLFLQSVHKTIQCPTIPAILAPMLIGMQNWYAVVQQCL